LQKETSLRKNSNNNKSYDGLWVESTLSYVRMLCLNAGG